GLEQIIGDHRIERDAAQLDSQPSENNRVVFQVLADLFDGRILEDRLQHIADKFRIELWLARGSANRDIARFAGCPSKGKAHDFGAPSMSGSGFGIEAESLLLSENLHQLI